MTVLVAAASKHGATREIADAIARELARRDVSAEVWDVSEVDDLDRFDGVVLGSAVYMGHWLETARKFVERRGPDLAGKRTWLFSSGPVGEPAHMPKEAQDVCDIENFLSSTNALEHRLFSGKLDKSKLRLPRAGRHARSGGSGRRLPRLGRYRGLGQRHRLAGQVTLVRSPG